MGKNSVYGSMMKNNEPMARYTTFKIGGPADLFYVARNTEELVTVITEARNAEFPVFVLGGGTNILIGDKGIRGLVVKNSTSRMVRRGVQVEADSGVSFNKLVRFTIDEGLSGLEMHLGLPGTVGGAVYMNSKWTHPKGYVGDVVHQAEILTPSNTLELVPKRYFRFGYDTSVIQKSHDIVTKVIFALHADDKEHIWKRANESIAYRRQTQPQGIFSAGCTFRNISKTSAGLLVDQAGLKGLVIGDAQISPVHANFIVNLGKASASDVIQLIDRAKEQVKRQFGIELEEEIVRVGEF